MLRKTRFYKVEDYLQKKISRAATAEAAFCGKRGKLSLSARDSGCRAATVPHGSVFDPQDVLNRRWNAINNRHGRAASPSRGGLLRHRQGSINVDEREGVEPFLHLLGTCQRRMPKSLKMPSA
jgi:hypothetical protein